APDERVLFLEIERADVSDFGGPLYVRGAKVDSHQVRRASSASVRNAIAALLIYLRDATGQLPHAYFGCTEGNPMFSLFLAGFHSRLFAFICGPSCMACAAAALFAMAWSRMISRPSRFVMMNPTPGPRPRDSWTSVISV